MAEVHIPNPEQRDDRTHGDTARGVMAEHLKNRGYSDDEVRILVENAPIDALIENGFVKSFEDAQRLGVILAEHYPERLD